MGQYKYIQLFDAGSIVEGWSSQLLDDFQLSSYWLKVSPPASRFQWKER
jgi:hypothetical protein